jgi:hypothetical protein
MTQRTKIIPFVLSLLVLALGGSACQLPVSLPFLQTSTPQPTYTPYPTYTPPPPAALWEVEVLSAIRSDTFGDLYYEASTNTVFLILTIQYTWLGEETTQFFPMSVVLLQPEDSSYPGGAYTAAFYQPENTTAVQNFITTRPPIVYILPGETRIEKFSWSLSVDGTDTRLQLLFPETLPLDFVISSQ